MHKNKQENRVNVLLHRLSNVHICKIKLHIKTNKQKPPSQVENVGENQVVKEPAHQLITCVCVYVYVCMCVSVCVTVYVCVSLCVCV